MWDADGESRLGFEDVKGVTVPFVNSFNRYIDSHANSQRAFRTGVPYKRQGELRDAEAAIRKELMMEWASLSADAGMGDVVKWHGWHFASRDHQKKAYQAVADSPIVGRRC